MLILLCCALLLLFFPCHLSCLLAVLEKDVFLNFYEFLFLQLFRRKRKYRRCVIGKFDACNDFEKIHFLRFIYCSFYCCTERKVSASGVLLERFFQCSNIVVTWELQQLGWNCIIKHGDGSMGTKPLGLQQADARVG